MPLGSALRSEPLRISFAVGLGRRGAGATWPCYKDQMPIFYHS